MIRTDKWDLEKVLSLMVCSLSAFVRVNWSAFVRANPRRSSGGVERRPGL